ncbi:MAG: hypothetical protein GYA62_11255 [Bacteroidales bacterium]|nr:hypothetical protein [Bacteroidales bacterium]
MQQVLSNKKSILYGFGGTTEVEKSLIYDFLAVISQEKSIVYAIHIPVSAEKSIIYQVGQVISIEKSIFYNFTGVTFRAVVRKVSPKLTINGIVYVYELEII